MSIRTSINLLESRIDAHQEDIEEIGKIVRRLDWIADILLAFILLAIVTSVIWLAVELVKLRCEM